MTAVVLALVLLPGGTATAAATVSGTVVDAIGAAVTDARVALTTADGTHVQAAATGVKGEFTLAAHETLDWTAFAGASVAAALDQSTAAHPGFGDGPSGYAKRWAASFADDRTGDLLSHYVFASVFRQDPRYFYQGAGTTKSRLIHALGSAFLARSDRGTTMPNYAQIFGNIGAAALSNVYYPHSERGGSLMVSTLAIGLASRAAKAVTQQFLGRRLTTHVPAGD